MSLKKLLTGQFDIITEERIYRNQNFLEIKEGKLVTKALLRVPLVQIKAIKLHKLPTKIKPQGRYGKWRNFKITETPVEARIITETANYCLIEVRNNYYIVRREAECKTTKT